ncbi:hypothetical protein F5X99DRAFT_209195 [Biscogniauxia marginata]|nr:hypothetical protein F5X99DRAFT_209195 [Biscogniauxia marginata]
MLAKSVTNNRVSLLASHGCAMLSQELHKTIYGGLYLLCLFVSNFASNTGPVQSVLHTVRQFKLLFRLDGTLPWRSIRSTNQVNAQYTCCASTGLDFFFRCPLPGRGRDDRV